jgi:hypothetical protein
MTDRLANLIQPETSPIAAEQTATTSAASQAAAAGWGLLPLLCFTNSLALLTVAYANTLSRNSIETAPLFLWIGLLVIFVPTAVRLLSPTINRPERIGLVILLGCSLYMVKVLHSPMDFTFHDEFLHWRTTENILVSDRLFTPNSILPVSPLYPGLEIITAALSDVSGLSIVDSGVIMLGIARVGFMLALFLFYEAIGSSQIGGLAALLYTANSNFLYFDSQYSYESLSLPIAMTILYIVASRNEKYEERPLKTLILALPMIGAVAITHHLTGYVVTGFLFLWAFMALLRRRQSSRWLWIGVFALVTLVAVAGWTRLVGNATSNYLGPVFRSGVGEVVGLVFDEGGGRELFKSETGVSSPVWERFVGIGAIVFILLMLPVGTLQVLLSPFRQRPLASRIATLTPEALRSWQRYQNNGAALALAALIVLHPVMQAFRLTSSGWEIANRSSEFLFWAIAFILAIGVVSVSTLPIPRRLFMIGFAIWVSVIFVGGAISGWPPWSRQPGPYMVSADSRSVEPESLLAANWANDYLPAQSRMAADRINTLLMSVYGNQRMITHLADEVYLASVYFSKIFGRVEYALLKQTDVEYMVVDKRMSEELPLVGVYFEAGEPGNDRTEPVDPEALAKFDTLEGVDRIFDSGNIRIYDVGELREAF